MRYIHTNKLGLLLATTLLVMLCVQFYKDSKPMQQTLILGHATHGLRVYVDPDTGQYTQPSPQAIESEMASLSALATIKPRTILTTEKASLHRDGGFTIELREQFRPSRKGP